MRPLRSFLLATSLVLCATAVKPTMTSADSGFNRGPQGSGQFWVSADYLHWQFSGMEIPALVTGNPIGTPIGEAGIIGAPSTRVLLGNQSILDGFRSGHRYRAGAWLTCNLGVEIDYFGFARESAGYRYDENSNLIIGRPFINLAPLPAGSDPRYDTQLITFQNLVTGSIQVSASSQFQSFGARAKFNPLRDCCSRCLSCAAGGGCDASGSCDGILEPGCGSEGGCDGSCQGNCRPTPRCNRCTFAFTLGYRHLELKEQLSVNEELQTAIDQLAIVDRFGTNSRFNGLELGYEWSCQYLCFYLDAFGRLGVGTNRNDVSISGQTTDNSGGTPIINNAGILVQSSNRGTYSQDVASMMMELGFNGSVHIAQGVSLTAGYSVLYWGNVAQAGAQIDPNLHPGLFEPATATLGTIGAQPTHALSDLVGHGVNIGLVYVF